MALVLASLSLSAPVAANVKSNALALNVSSTLANVAGDTCAIEGLTCTTDSDCSPGNPNNAGEPSTCSCYYSPDGRSVPCEGSNRMPQQLCSCHPVKVGYNRNCVADFDCLSGHCVMSGIGDHGCAP